MQMTEVIERDALDVNHLHAHDQGGSRQFSARVAPWMKLGTVIDKPVTASEAARLAGMDFEVDLLSVGYAYPPRGETDDSPEWNAIPSRRAVVRRDTGDVFDVVSQDYRPVQYAEAFTFMDAVSPHCVAAGTLRNGRQGFMVVQRPDMKTLDLELSGEHDPHELFVVLRTSHDRSRGLEVSIMPLRGRCMNELPLAGFTFTALQRWSVHHIGDPVKKLTAATQVFHNVEVYANEYAETARLLAETDVLIDEVEDILKAVLPERPMRDRQIGAITAAWQESPHVGFAGSGWGLVNAVSEYFEWQRESATRTTQSQFLSSLEGSTSKIINRTSQLLLRRR